MRGRRLIVLLAAGLVAGCSPSPSPEAGSGLPAGTLEIRTSEGTVGVRVEIAETPEDKARGLMGRESLGASDGMVFLEDQPVQASFWMKDTLIPLSVAFWDTEERIFAILDMEPCEEDPCPHYDPQGEWIGAVEVNRGFFEDEGVKVGDTVALTRS